MNNILNKLILNISDWVVSKEIINEISDNLDNNSNILSMIIEASGKKPSIVYLQIALKIFITIVYLCIIYLLISLVIQIGTNMVNLQIPIYFIILIIIIFSLIALGYTYKSNKVLQVIGITILPTLIYLVISMIIHEYILLYQYIPQASHVQKVTYDKNITIKSDDNINVVKINKSTNQQEDFDLAIISFSTNGYVHNNLRAIDYDTYNLSIYDNIDYISNITKKGLSKEIISTSNHLNTIYIDFMNGITSPEKENLNYRELKIITTKNISIQNIQQTGGNTNILVILDKSLEYAIKNLDIKYYSCYDNILENTTEENRNLIYDNCNNDEIYFYMDNLNFIITKTQ